MGSNAGMVETTWMGGRYAFERMLGRGGMGEVFLAFDQQLGRWVAIKRVRTDGTGSPGTLMAEARHLASLQHPNIVTVYDFLEHEGDLMVVMEYIQGQTLEDLTAPLPWEDFLEVARGALEGMGAAHSLGIIHRDIKPGNIMLAFLPTGKFQVKILDFGLAKVAVQPSVQTEEVGGSLLGSVFTMAPEQLDRRPVDHRADLYALGCVFFWALTGRNAFEGATVPELISSHLRHEVTPLGPLRPDLPTGAGEWLEALYAFDPADRPADAATAWQMLQEIGTRKRAAVGRPVLAPTTVQKKKASLVWVWVASVVIALGAVGWVLLGPKTGPAGDAPPATGGPVAVAPAFRANDRTVLLENLGKEIQVEGRIGRVGENKSGTISFLNFEGGQRGDLSLVFFHRDFPDLQREKLEGYIGSEVRVSGTLTEFKGDPQMEIRDFNQITVLP